MVDELLVESFNAVHHAVGQATKQIVEFNKYRDEEQYVFFKAVCGKDQRSQIGKCCFSNFRGPLALHMPGMITPMFP
eukprot:7066704-Karenia_brevis.AAC.1